MPLDTVGVALASFHSSRCQLDEAFQKICRQPGSANADPDRLPGFVSFPVEAGIKQIDSEEVFLSLLPAIQIKVRNRNVDAEGVPIFLTNRMRVHSRDVRIRRQSPVRHPSFQTRDVFTHSWLRRFRVLPL